MFGGVYSLCSMETQSINKIGWHVALCIDF